MTAPKVISHSVNNEGMAADCTLRFASAESAAAWLAEHNSVQVDDRLTILIVRASIDARYERPMGTNRKLVQVDVTVFVDGWPQWAS